MNNFNTSMAQGRTMDASVNVGLRNFMLGVYNKLALGIAVSGIIAYIAGSVAPVSAVIYSQPIVWIVMFAPIALILASNFMMRNPSPTSSALLYWGIVVGLGLSMGVYFLMANVGVGGMTHFVIAKAFLATAATFAGLSLFGYTTKRDLGPIGTFAIMGLWGAFIIGMLFFILPMMFPNVAFFQVGSVMQLVISGAFALFSAILIAWNTQSLKETYFALGGDQRGMAVATNIGALNFFIYFVNIFQFFLSLLSSD
ncbi:MAG: Bax inhibitor-1/YccA family protein [Pseudomonadota bacterium]